MTHLVVGALTLAGFALLLIAMPRHQQDWLRRKLAGSTSRLLKCAGLAALVLAFAASGRGLGWAYGTVAWCGWLSLSAVLVLTAQTNRDRILRLFA